VQATRRSDIDIPQTPRSFTATTFNPVGLHFLPRTVREFHAASTSLHRLDIEHPRKPISEVIPTFPMPMMPTLPHLPCKIFAATTTAPSGAARSPVLSTIATGEVCAER